MKKKKKKTVKIGVKGAMGMSLLFLCGDDVNHQIEPPPDFGPLIAYPCWCNSMVRAGQQLSNWDPMIATITTDLHTDVSRIYWKKNVETIFLIV